MRLVLLALVALTHGALAGPRVMPFVAAPGTLLDSNVMGGTYCPASKRGVFRLVSGNIVAVDPNGTLVKLGSPGAAGVAGLLACDRKDRVFVVAGLKLMVLSPDGKTTTETLKTEMRHIRVLDDDSLGLVDGSGSVHRWDGSKVTLSWVPAAAAGNSERRGTTQLFGDGEKYVMVRGSKALVVDRTNKIEGPNALSATWLDANNVVSVDARGLVTMWTPGSPATVTLDEPPAPVRFNPRVTVHRAGRRLVLENFNGEVRTIELDATNHVVATRTLGRVPLGVRHVATGDVPFAIIAVEDRAVVVDLARSYDVVDIQHPLAAVSAMAFSPDGRWLAMLGGDRDVLVAATDRSAITRLTTTANFVRGPLAWTPDGSVFAKAVNVLLRWNLDGTTSSSTINAIGFTPRGDVISLGRPKEVVVEHPSGQQLVLRISDDARFAQEADATDRYIAVRGARGIEVFPLEAGAAHVFRTKDQTFLRAMTLAGDRPAVMFVDDKNGLHLATENSDTVLDTIDQFSALAATTDRRRIAVAGKSGVTIFDEQGRKLWLLTTTARIQALAWSPDLRTLAVSSRSGVELWTVPL